MPDDNVSKHSRGIALALCSVLGVVGGHRFYVGRWASGLAMLGTLGGLGLWWLYDMILVTAGGFRDSEGKLVRGWSEPGEISDNRPGRHKELRPSEEVMEELYHVREDMAELSERMDFMERLLAQAKQRSSLPTS